MQVVGSLPWCMRLHYDRGCWLGQMSQCFHYIQIGRWWGFGTNCLVCGDSPFVGVWGDRKRIQQSVGSIRVKFIIVVQYCCYICSILRIAWHAVFPVQCTNVWSSVLQNKDCHRWQPWGSGSCIPGLVRCDVRQVVGLCLVVCRIDLWFLAHKQDLGTT